MANATITVVEADGSTLTDVVVLDVGRQAAAASKSVAASTEDKAVLDSIASSASTTATAAAVMDDWDESDRAKVNLIAGQVGVTGGSGAVDAATLRVAIATDTSIPSVVPGTGATNLGKAIDAASGATDTGVAVLAIRDDSLSTLTPAEGDWVGLRVNSTGALHVTGGGGGTEYIEDDPAAANPTGNIMIAVRRDTLATNEVSADGDNIALKATNKGKLHVAAELRSGDTAITVGAGAADATTLRTTLDTDQLAASLNAVAVMADGYQLVGLPTDQAGLKAEDAASAGGDYGWVVHAMRQDTPANTSGTDGDYEPFRMSAGRLWVASNSVGNVAHDAVGTGSSPILIGGYASAAAPTDVSGDGDAVRMWLLRNGSPVVTVNGSMVAHDAADAGNPIKVGAKASTSVAGVTLVANNDRTDLYAGVDGVQIVRPHTGLEDLISGVLENTDGNSTAVIAALGAGIKGYITTVIISNTSASAVEVDLRDGAAGSVKATFPVPANTSGVVCNLPVPLGFSANTAICMDASAAASTVTCTLIGFKSKV